MVIVRWISKNHFAILPSIEINVWDKKDVSARFHWLVFNIAIATED